MGRPSSGFRWAKSPWHLQAFYLQNPQRVAGLGCLLVLAGQFVRWMRRMVREALRDQPPLALPDGRRIAAPSDEVRPVRLAIAVRNVGGSPPGSAPA